MLKKSEKKAFRKRSAAKPVKVAARKVKDRSPRSRKAKKGAAPKLSLKKYRGNPILWPDPDHPWESKATFNPAAMEKDGKVHLVYRAIGDNDRSVLGYASSKDGLKIDERLPQPIYVPQAHREAASKKWNPDYVSGGGWGGCEDPRLTCIDDKVYMTYVAFDGWSPPRIALTSIKTDDFLKKNWKWKRAKIISRPGVVDKSAGILPEKINGKFVVFHRVYPNILIDFVDDLEFENSYLEGKHKIEPRADAWDSRKIGIGGPPMKTKYGWLLIYYAVDDKDSGRYKIGAMLLDPQDPRKVLRRSDSPILSPEHWYENSGWKYGVVYPCGAIIKDEKLFVYYGGSDSFVCAATADLEEFATELINSGSPKLKRQRAEV